MLVDLTQNSFDLIQSNLQTAGLSFAMENISYSDFSLSPDGKQMSAAVSLPDSSKTCSDYMAAILWLRHSSGRYTGFPLSHKFPIAYDPESPAASPYMVLDIADSTTGAAVITISEDPVPADNPDFDFLQDVYKIMYIYSDTSDFTIANTLVTESIEEAFTFTNYLFSVDNYNILTNKSNLLTLCYEYDQSKIAKCFRLTQVSPAKSREDVVILADTYYKRHRYYFQNNSNLLIHFFNYVLDEVDIEMLDIVAMTEEDFAALSGSKKQHLAEKNKARLQAGLNTYGSSPAAKNKICFPQDKVIYVTGSLMLANNTKLVGNNCTLKIYDNTTTSTCMFIHHNVAAHDAEITDLNIVGRTEEFVNDEFTYADQAFFYSGRSKLLSNLKLYNVTISNFLRGLHVTGMYQPPEEGQDWEDSISMDWVFDHCNIIKCSTNFLISGVNNMSVINSHIDNSLSKDDYDHAFYMGEHCSNILIENCLIENSAGYAIRLDGVSGLAFNDYSRNDIFRNITIKNCYRGIWLGKAANTVTVENINAIGVVRALKLENCINVTINNYNASGTTVIKHIRTIGSEVVLINKAASVALQVDPFIVFSGKVDAVLNNCHFNCENELFRKESVNSSNIQYMSEHHNDYFETIGDNRVLTDKVVFNNCMFDSAMGGEKLGFPTSESLSFIYKSDITFNDCQFMFSHKEIDNSHNFYFKGNITVPSIYSFNRCILIDYVKVGDTSSLTHNEGYFFHGDYLAASFGTNAYGFTVNVNDSIILTNVSNNKELVTTPYNVNPLHVFRNNTPIDVVTEEATT